MENLKFSPLFWPVKFKKDTLYVLDETLLPQRLEYLKVNNYRDASRLIRNMKTRAVGQVLLVLYIFMLIFKRNKGKKSLAGILSRATDSLNNSRPTLSFRYLTDMVTAWFRQGYDLDKRILDFLDMLKNKRIEQAKKASLLLKNKDIILTHCNVSGLLPLTGEFCRRQRKDISFFVTETRPYLQGSRLTAWELHSSGFKVTVISDNMVAQVMKEGLIDKVVVGADNLARNGDIANKIGTYQIALLADHFNIPFYVFCPPPSPADTGEDIKIEIRPDKELLRFGSKLIAPAGVKGYYPAFDITPRELISKHINLDV
ncbi:MAG: S-methyl-5-thioribose-1-phosphate isomerase [Candidatus Omnitrophica bacterium]|nr:S-methyl-5-thioribose-1-phosphate isomerase [Candidatus Omnitrophota bacterium]MBD3269377.1 S-methyl-5-thioribose-1-phosphate isomerase [Candidatus Omnitrophota bacterium]